MSKQCECGSYAINHNLHSRDGSDGHLCDVCYWRERASSIDSLVRRLDVALNGEEGAAPQAMLCDIVAQVESGKYPALEAVVASQAAFDEMFDHCVSNGVFNAWQKPMDCTKLNAAIHLTGRVMRMVKS